MVEVIALGPPHVLDLWLEVIALGPPHVLDLWLEVIALGPPHVLDLWLEVDMGMVLVRYFFPSLLKNGG